MAKKIIMPKQGLQMTEGIITSWLAREGERVEEGQPLFEMETDKLTITIDSSATGTLLKILRPEGEAVPVAQTIAIVGQPGENIAALLQEAQAAPQNEGAPAADGIAPIQPPLAGRQRLFATPRARMRAGEMGLALEDAAASGPDGLIVERDVLAARVRATPLARREAQREGVDLEQVAGSGKRGKVTVQDVRRAAAPEAQAQAEETRLPLSGMRKIIAQRMCDSLRQLAQANHRMEVDMSECTRLRQQLKESGIKASFNDLVVMCTARALSEFPMMNASIDGGEIVLKRRINIGLAVATDKGLLVPVIHGADRLSLAQIGERARDLGNRSREGGLSPDELAGGTFTVTNLGMYGVDHFTAIINAPEAGILAVGQIKKRPVVLEDDSLAARPMMWLSLTYDHRIVDGAPAAQFLGRVKALLEKPALLL